MNTKRIGETRYGAVAHARPPSASTSSSAYWSGRCWRCSVAEPASLLLVGLLHSVFNRTNNENGIAATLLEGDARQLAMLIAVVLLTTVTAVVVRSRPGRQYGVELAERSRTGTASRTA